jgi:proteic killer suppression protein
VLRYTIQFKLVIKSYRHKGLKRFYETGSRAGIQASHASRLARQLVRLNSASSPKDMNLPGWRLHSLQGDLAGKWAVNISGNWRLVFEFKHGNAFGVDYDDYH